MFVNFFKSNSHVNFNLPRQSENMWYSVTAMEPGFDSRQTQGKVTLYKTSVDSATIVTNPLEWVFFFYNRAA